MQRFASVALILCVAISVALGDAPLRITNPTICTGSHYQWVNISQYYLPGTPNTALCIFSDYEVACPTLNGLQACDNYNQGCVQWVGSQTWKATAGAASWTANFNPSVCMNEASTWFMDSRVVSTAQVIASSFTFLIAIVVLLWAQWARHNWLSIFVLIFMLCAGVTLTVSYYYLNAIIIIGASCISATFYTYKSPAYTGLGALIAVTALYWVTFQSGLGQIQHHFRLSVGDSVTDYFEATCSNYYRGKFLKPSVYAGDSDNQQVQYQGYCTREFLAGELYVMILLELLLVLLVTAGAYSLSYSDEEKPEDSTQPRDGTQ